MTDPGRPVYLHHIPATGGAQGAQMAQVCSSVDLPGAAAEDTYLLRANGNQSHEVWEVSDPSNPTFVTTVARRAVRLVARYVPLTAVPGDMGDRGLSIRRERGYWSGRRS
ncbi:MAG TPA: hypothetical protein DEQ98_11585 [Acidobacteria bacterium]|nr:hypothetical protein [Acidobacteriota bacterium]